jgi:hypothetical protein
MPIIVAEIAPEEMKTRRMTEKSNDEMYRLYRQILDSIPLGGGIEFTLDQGEEQRKVKRRFTIAAKGMGREIRWIPPEKGGSIALMVKDPRSDNKRKSDSDSTRRFSKGTSRRSMDDREEDQPAQ